MPTLEADGMPLMALQDRVLASSKELTLYVRFLLFLMI